MHSCLFDCIMSSSNSSRSIVLRLLQQHLQSSSPSNCSSVSLAVSLASSRAHLNSNSAVISDITSNIPVGPCSSSNWKCSSSRCNGNSTEHTGHQHTDIVRPQRGCQTHILSYSASNYSSSTSSSSRWGQQQAQHTPVQQQLINSPQWPSSRAAANGLYSGVSSGSSSRCIFSSSSNSSSTCVSMATSSSSSASSRSVSTSSAVHSTVGKAAAGEASSSSSSKASSTEEKVLAIIAQAKEAHPFKEGQKLDGGRYLLEEINWFNYNNAEGFWQSDWLGTDLQSGQQMHFQCTEAGDADSYSTAMREAALHAVLGSCPNILGPRDAFEHRDSSGRHPVMVFDKPSASLQEVISDYIAEPQDGFHHMEEIHGTCDNPLVLKKIARDVLTGLDHLHSRGLVHRNLIPTRVVLDKPFESRFFRSDQFTATFRNLWNILKGGVKKISSNALKEALDKQQEQYSERTLHEATFKLCNLSAAVTYANWQTVQRASGLPVQSSQTAAAAAAAAAAAQALSFRSMQVAGEQGVVPPPIAPGVIINLAEVYMLIHCQPPEALLGMPHIAPSYDMWQFGCLMAFAATKKLPFDSTLASTPMAQEYNYDRDHWILSSMVQRLGHMPRGYGRTSPRRAEFFHQGSGYDTWDYLKLHAGPLKPMAGLEPIYKFLQEETVLENTVYGVNNAKPFADFLNEVLRWEPSSRASARDLLQHPWLQDDS